MQKSNISNSVIRRLPRYYRFLGELLNQDIQKISSRELSEKMRLTASQIRQDLNCFGGLVSRATATTWRSFDVRSGISSVLTSTTR